MTPVVVALFARLDANETAPGSESQFAFEALLRCKEEMGIQEFTRRSMRASFAERERFKQIEFRQKEAHEGMSFGIVSPDTMDMLRNKSDRQERAGTYYSIVITYRKVIL